MATVVWTDKAKLARRKLYVEGVVNFGIATALKIAYRIESITGELECFPESGYQEPLLMGQGFIYRARHINRRFKIIYCSIRQTTWLSSKISGIRVVHRRILLPV
jgi:plasmid stabilization system protein ParE